MIAGNFHTEAANRLSPLVAGNRIIASSAPLVYSWVVQDKFPPLPPIVAEIIGFHPPVDVLYWAFFIGCPPT